MSGIWQVNAACQHRELALVTEDGTHDVCYEPVDLIVRGEEVPDPTPRCEQDNHVHQTEGDAGEPDDFGCQLGSSWQLRTQEIAANLVGVSLYNPGF